MSEFFSDIAGRFYLTFIFENRWQFFAEGFIMTILLTFASFLGGTLLGALFCALRFTKSKAVNNIFKVITNLLIQLPTLVLLMVFVYMIFSGTSLSVTIVVCFGLMLKCSAYLADVFYSAVSNVNSGEAEAARTLGMTAMQTFLNITLPQAINAALPLYQNQFIVALQETSLVGTLAIMDLTKASNIITTRTYDAFFGLIFISVIYLLIGLAGSRLLSFMRARKHLGGGKDD